MIGLSRAGGLHDPPLLFIPVRRYTHEVGFRMDLLKYNCSEE